LESWLEGKNQKVYPEDFEKAVSILLSLCGLRTMHVGEIYETTTVQSRRDVHTKTSVGLDIITLLPTQEDNDISLCQCVTDWKDEKINDILDISNELKQMLESEEIKIYPILITRVEAHKISASKAMAEALGIKVMTIDNLRVLLGEIRANKKPYEIAKSLISNI
jgi:hypothetical protein